jgi:7-cyano-7-deazaguanine synthase
MVKALTILSGGQDSTTCLYWAKKHYDEVVALTFNYNQRHIREIESAKIIAKLAKVPHEIIDMGSIFAGLSPLTDHKQSVENYGSANDLPGGLEKTFVPGRNILFLCVAANRAYVTGCDDMIVGVSEEDFGGYPDCRLDFIRKMEEALKSGLDRSIAIKTPLIHLTKRKTVELAQTLAGCMEALAHSTTCYNGDVPPCGHCHSCLLRQKGFSDAGVDDPLLSRGLLDAR